MGTLYVVGLPAGHPEDMTLRARRVLRQVDLVVAASPAGCARELLAGCGIETPLLDCQAGDDEGLPDPTAALETALQALDSYDVALLFEAEGAAAGDWGHRLVRLAAGRGCPVVSVPGPSAAVTALVLSGLPADAFVCLGRLSQDEAGRRALLASLAADSQTLLTFVTATHLTSALRDVVETLGDRPVALFQESDRPEPQVWRGMAREALTHLAAGPPRGEWTLVVGGAAEAARWLEAQVRAELARLLAEGVSRKAAARRVAQVSGWRPREVYRLAG